MKQRLILLLFFIIILVCNVAIQFWMGVCILFNTDRAISIAMAWDRLGNATMGQGDKETISSWSGRHGGWQERFINWLFFNLTGEVNHCDNNREVLV